MILAGTYRSGEKLPPERELAEQLNASRPSVRSALAKLELQGMVTRVQGDGTYVSGKVESTFADPLLALFKQDENFKYDVLEYRLALEEACCALAAEKATDDDKQNIQQRFDEWMAIHNAQAQSNIEAQADLAFHLAIAEATHNYIFLHAMKSSHTMMQQSVEVSLNYLYEASHRRTAIVEQHTAILNAILNSDSEGARQAIRNHLNFVRSEVHKSDIERQRHDRARRNKAL